MGKGCQIKLTTTLNKIRAKSDSGFGWIKLLDYLDKKEADDVEKCHPDDKRQRNAIQGARDHIGGKINLYELLKLRAADAAAYAKEKSRKKQEEIIHSILGV